MVLQRVIKPKTQKGKRALENKESKVHENDKTAMFIRGGHTSDTVTQAMKELNMLKKPLSVQYRRKNIMRPFEDQTPIERFSQKTDSSLFLFGSHSKKRPNNLVIGRLYDNQVLDMVELGIEAFVTMSSFKSGTCTLGSKPCLLFSGEAFDESDEFKRLKNLMIDFFRGPVVENIALQGLEHILSFTAHDGKVAFRSYKIVMKKSGTRVPRVELEEMGPRLDLSVRRSRLASDDLFKIARKVPKEAKIKKRKNISRDVFGTQHGRVHMQKQDLNRLQTRKLKGLKKRKSDVSAAEDVTPEKVKKSDS